MNSCDNDEISYMEASVPVTPISNSVVVIVHHIADYRWSSDLIAKLSSLKQVSCRFMSVHDDLLFVSLKESKMNDHRTNASAHLDRNFGEFLDIKQREDGLNSGIIANVSDLNFQQVFRDVTDCQINKNNLNKYTKSFSFYQRVYYSLNQSHRSIFVFSKTFLEDLWPEMSDCKMISSMKGRESILLFVTPLCSNDQLLTVSQIRNTLEDNMNSDFESIRTTNFIEDIDTKDEDVNNSTPLLNIPHDCTTDPPSELKELPIVRVCLRGGDRETWWFRKLVAWIVVGTSEAPKHSSQDLKNGQVLFSIETVHFNCCYSKTKLKDKLKKELKILQYELDKRKLVILPIESLVKEISGKFQVNCTRHLLFHHAPTMCLLFTILFFACVLPFPYMESAILGGNHATTTTTTNSYIRGLIVWLSVLICFLLCIFTVNRKCGRRLLKDLGRLNQNLLKKMSVMAGVEKLGFIDLNKRILHFMYYDYSPCVAFLQEHVVKYCSNKQMKDQQPMSTQDGPINSNELEPLDGNNDGVVTNTTIQLRTDSLLLEYTGKYACLLASMKLYRPITDRHMSECVCLCQFIEKFVKK